ncbi:MAG: glycosyltransferase [Myxococcota bacterium]
MAVALVHDWLVAQRGGENVLLEMARLFPEAPIYTLVHAPGTIHPELERHPIRTSFIQRLPGAPDSFRRYLPLFPAAVEAWRFDEFDLILSTSHCVAKGVRTHEHQKHIAYIHTPMRYLWDQLPEYVPRLPGRALLTPLARALSAPLRRWDVRSATRPDLLVANSAHVAARIDRVWRRPAEVLYPPVDVAAFAEAPEVRGKRHRRFLVVSALVPYKRVDVAVRAATMRGLPLDVVGDGPELRRLRRMAGPSVRFIGSLSPDRLVQAYAEARALLFCGVEDFGIVPVEAMAAGCPVIGLREGGVLETVVENGEGATGLFFDRPEPDSLLAAISRFEALESDGGFDRAVLEARARRFGREQFVSGLKKILS